MPAIFCSTAECASAEKPRPPYSFGMIMPKNFFFLRKSQVSGVRSARSCVISQSSIMRQSSSTGPSRNACSSTESVGFGCASSFDQSGLPLKSSPSKPTVPASSAICSVSESFGVTFWKIASSGALSLLPPEFREVQRHRDEREHEQRTPRSRASRTARASRRATIATGTAIVQTRRPIRKYAAASDTTNRRDERDERTHASDSLSRSVPRNSRDMMGERDVVVADDHMRRVRHDERAAHAAPVRGIRRSFRATRRRWRRR